MIITDVKAPGQIGERTITLTRDIAAELQSNLGIEAWDDLSPDGQRDLYRRFDISSDSDDEIHHLNIRTSDGSLSLTNEDLDPQMLERFMPAKDELAFDINYSSVRFVLKIMSRWASYRYPKLVNADRSRGLPSGSLTKLGRRGRVVLDTVLDPLSLA